VLGAAPHEAAVVEPQLQVARAAAHERRGVRRPFWHLHLAQLPILLASAITRRLADAEGDERAGEAERDVLRLGAEHGLHLRRLLAAEPAEEPSPRVATAELDIRRRLLICLHWIERRRAAGKMRRECRAGGAFPLGRLWPSPGAWKHFFSPFLLDAQQPAKKQRMQAAKRKV